MKTNRVIKKIWNETEAIHIFFTLPVILSIFCGFIFENCSWF